MRPEKNNESKYLWRTVLISAIAAIIALLPALVYGRGMLMLSDDFTYQQQIFNVYYGELFKAGNIFGWSWFTDLGSPAAPSYSFYNLFSPFTLLFAFLPAKIIPYATAPMLVLKYTVAAVLAYFFIKRFVKHGDSAVFGAVLYAFSGAQTVNLLFPFHDATAIFPLLLIGIEEVGGAFASWSKGKGNSLSKINLRGLGLLAIAAALSAATNYFLFFGEIIFAIIYYLLRFGVKNWRGILACLAGGFVGAMAAGVVLLPSALSVLSNPRVGSVSGEILFDWSRYLTILQAYFMPTDVMGMRNAFLQHECSSCGLTLPFVSMALCFGYAYENKKSRLTWLMAVLALFSVVPILNSAFSMFNSHYYARWYFMAALVFALCSSLATDNWESPRKPLVIGSFVNLICTLGTAFLCLLAWLLFKIKGRAYITDQVNLPVLLAIFGVGILFSVLVYIIVKKSRCIIAALTVGAIIAATISTGSAALRYSLGTGKTEHYGDGTVNHEGQPGVSETLYLLTEYSEKINAQLPDDENYRVRTDWHDANEAYFANSYDNASLLIKKPSVNSFISTVSGGIFEFYEALGSERVVTTVGDFSDELMLLLSVKYRISESAATPYEYFLPLGFSYNKFIKPSELEALPQSERATAMLNFLVLENGEELGLTHGSTENMVYDLSELTQRDKSTEFSRGKNGFSAKITATENEFVFFSVPFDNGFKATVNGEASEIVKVAGLMAVKVEAGENNVEFTYKTPGLKAGALMSVCGIFLIGACYLGDFYIRRRKEYGRF